MSPVKRLVLLNLVLMVAGGALIGAALGAYMLWNLPANYAVIAIVFAMLIVIAPTIGTIRLLKKQLDQDNARLKELKS